MVDVLASPDVSAFSPEELDYLHGERRLARIATVGRDGTPHVVPVGCTHNREIDTIDVRGRRLDQTKKFRDAARNGRVAIVIDDLASVDPWHARAVEVRGRAETLTDSEALIRIHPERIVSWGIERHSRSVGPAEPSRVAVRGGPKRSRTNRSRARSEPPHPGRCPEYCQARIGLMLRRSKRPTKS